MSQIYGVCLTDLQLYVFFYKQLKTSLHKPRGNLLENLFSKKCAFKIITTFWKKFFVSNKYNT